MSDDPPPAGRRLLLIGIGAGDPGLLTQQAIEAFSTVDVFFLLEKRDEVDELTAFRRQILQRHARAAHRVVELVDPRRDLPAADADRADYDRAVLDWQERRAEVLAGALTEHLAPGGVGGLLVWGDPSLYDGSLRMVEDLAARLPWPLDFEVVPGVSSLHLLTARHRIPLNRVGKAVLITTGRRLLDSPPDADTDVVVFLDSKDAFAELDPAGIDIYWGAYLGLPDELLIAGPLAEVRDAIVAARREGRARKGWMFDVYLLRRRG